MSNISTFDQNKLLDIANQIADQAGKTASAYFRSGVDIDLKSDASPVTIADQQIEREARDLLNQSFPDHSILGEEFGAGDLTNNHVWIIDPVDGTRSFIGGHPLYGFLLAHMNQGICELGMIFMPQLQERFIGLKDQGATFNGQPIQSSKTTHIDDAILYINEGEKLCEFEPNVFSKLLKIGHTRRFAYDCYPHALLAAGHVDVVVDYDLKPFDYLPVAGVVEQAGGIITDWQGKKLDYASDGRVISAATPELHAYMIDLLSKEGSA